MNKIPKQIFILFLFIIPSFSFGQQSLADRDIEAIIESILENLDDETGDVLIVEDLEELAENPLNINIASEVDFSRLHLLNDLQIHNLIDYCIRFGPVYSIFELNTIDGFSPEILNRMEPFIRFGSPESKPVRFSESLNYGRHQFLSRVLGTVQIPKGYKEKEDGSVPYEGNRFRYYSRYRFNSDLLSFGFTAEKDPGESFFFGSNNKGFDFYSGYASAKINSLIENITVGDFAIRSGQGLVLWQGFSMNKSVNTLGIFKVSQGVRPYSSTDENRFFRGISTTLNFGKTKLNLFFSSKKEDGNLEFIDSVKTHFTSLQTSGYHRTKNEIADEKSVKNSNFGAVATKRFDYLKIGITALFQQFDLPYIRSDQLYNRFRFSGTQNYTLGMDYFYSRGMYQLFGEAAISKSKGKAFLQGGFVHLNDRLDFSLLFRHLDKNYHALWAAPFAEGSGADNETGLYFGARILPVKFVTISAYTDFYCSEWINYTTAGPATGWDVFVQADFRFSEKFHFYLRYKNEEKDQKTTLRELYQNRQEQIRRIRVHFQLNLSEKFVLSSRIENAFFRASDKENGFLVFEDLKFMPDSFPITISGRIAWFNTKSYNTRIYAYENDLLYSFSVPAFYGKGFRTYLNLKYRISERLDFWFKTGHTLYNDRETISSGYNEIQGNQKMELKFQLRLKI